MNYALYYPSIEFRNPDFLKRSLLVWDRVFRIVPNSYNPNDDASIITAISEKVVIDLRIDEHEKAKAAEGFLDFYRIRQNPACRLSLPAGLDSETFVRINPEKIEARLLPLFEELSRSLTRDGFLQIPADLAGGYMFYLAEAVAKQRSLQMLTDSPDTWAVGTYFAQAGNFDEYVYKEKADAYLCNMAVTDLLPDQLSHLSIDDVLRFVEKHREERAVFQQELEKLRLEISRCNNKEHARYIVNDFVSSFKKAKDEYRSAIGAFSKRELCSVFSSGVPTTLSVLSLPVFNGGNPYDPMHISVGLLFGAVSALATRTMIPVDKGRASYLVSVDRFSANPVVQLHRTFEEFVND